jgi:hypothetical protein
MNGSDIPRTIASRRLLLAFAVLVVLLTIGGAVSFVRYARRHAPNPQLVVVAPFDIFVPGGRLDAWRVRLAEALTEQLSATPPLSAVPQDVVRERWHAAQRPEIAAVELARRTSAGVAIYGRVDPIDQNPDSVRASIIVADAGSGRVLFGILLRWPARDADSLARTIAEHVRHNYVVPSRTAPPPPP